MVTSTTEIKVRYVETDQMGIVHHSKYAVYLELARIDWLEKMNLSYREMEDKGIGLPVINLNVNFKKSAYFDDTLKVVTKLDGNPSVKIKFSYVIYNQKDEVLSTATTTLCFMDMEARRPIRAPKYFTDKLEELSK